MKNHPHQVLPLILLIVTAGCYGCNRSNQDNPSNFPTNVGGTSITSSKFTKYYLGTFEEVTEDGGTGNTHEMEVMLTKDGTALTGKAMGVDMGDNFGTPYILDYAYIISEGSIDGQQNIKFKSVDVDNLGGTSNPRTWQGKFVSPIEIEIHTVEAPRYYSAKMKLKETPIQLFDSSEVVNPTLNSDEQVKRRVQMYFDTKFTRCGDSYYASFGGVLGEPSGIYQFRNPKFAILRKYPLTEANKLNQVSWSGQVDFVYDVTRIYERTWGAWRDYNKTREFTFNARKQSNMWNVEPDTVRFGYYRKVSCSEIPQ